MGSGSPLFDAHSSDDHPEVLTKRIGSRMKSQF
jgi:hypothetical protein